MVWVGVPRANISMRGLGGRGAVYGATFAAPIWKKFTDSYMAGQPAPEFLGFPPKQAVPSRPFVVPAGAPILGGSGGAPPNKGNTATTRRSSTRTTR